MSCEGVQQKSSELRPSSEAATKLSLLHRVRIFAEEMPHSSNEAILNSLPDAPASVRLRGGQKGVAGDVAVVFRRRPKYQGTTGGIRTTKQQRKNPAMYQTWRGDMMKYTSMRRMKTLKLPDWVVAETLIEHFCVLGKTSLQVSGSVRDFKFVHYSN